MALELVSLRQHSVDVVTGKDKAGEWAERFLYKNHYMKHCNLAKILIMTYKIKSVLISLKRES